MELQIQQIGLKQKLGNCQIIILIKVGESVKSIKLNLSQGQKVIKYTNPLYVSINSQVQNKYIHFFIQTEENNYNKVLGSKRINMVDWNNANQDRIVEIELENQNILSIILKCSQQINQDKIKAVDHVSHNKVNHPTIENSQWAKSLRKTDELYLNKSQVSGRKSPEQFDSRKSKQSSQNLTKTQALEECKQFLQNKKLSEHDENDHNNPNDPQLSYRTYTPLPNQLSPASQVQTRVQTEYSNDKSRHLKLNETSSQEEGQFGDSIQNRLSNLELMMAQKMLQKTPQQQKERYNYNNDLFEEQLYQYKHMIKEIALLLDINPDCSSIVLAISHLVKKERQQKEQIIKLQCDNQLIQSHLQNITIQQSVFQDKHQDLQKTVKQKLKIYETLFEENVQLKNTLKQDLQRIMNLSLELKQLKHETIDQIVIDKQISQLQIDIQKVCTDVEEKRIMNETLHEEVSLLQQMANDQLINQQLD